jgi:hypothetical protein
MPEIVKTLDRGYIAKADAGVNESARRSLEQPKESD